MLGACEDAENHSRLGLESHRIPRPGRERAVSEESVGKIRAGQ